MGIVLYALYTFILFHGNTSPIVQHDILPFSEAPERILMSCIILQLEGNNK